MYDLSTLKSPGHHLTFPFFQMLFTWDTDNLCIIFRQWRVSGPLTLTLSLLGVAALTAGYELVRKLARDYEESKQPLLERRDSDTPRMQSSISLFLEQ